jgi:hypothetical protein
LPGPLKLPPEPLGAPLLARDRLLVDRADRLRDDIELLESLRVVDLLLLNLDGLLGVLANEVALEVGLVLLARRRNDLGTLRLSLLPRRFLS